MATSSSSTATSSATSKMITLKSSDDEIFQVEESILSESQTLKHLIEDDCTDQEIPLANVSASTVAKVIEYLKKHADSGADADLKKWDANFVKLDQVDLFNLTIAANYLEIKSLMDLTCQTIADKVKTMPAKKIAKYFNITCDFTPEEIEEIKRKRDQGRIFE
ncbi:hypothetical protein ACHQM5_010021 [Ranunculus cassubicifolius]